MKTGYLLVLIILAIVLLLFYVQYQKCLNTGKVIRTTEGTRISCNFFSVDGIKDYFFGGLPCSTCGESSTMTKEAWIADCVAKALSQVPANVNFVMDPAIGIRANCEAQWNASNSQISANNNLSQQVQY